MAIKVSFPIGTSDIKVNGLHQWDYGQVLEIECVEIGSEMVEIHFACHGMTEAIVRPCTFANGIGTVIIPDRCLEQASNITAWVYRIVKDVADDGTEIVIQGHTAKTITLPVIARTRPSKSYDNISSGDIDKYKEALVEINEAVHALKEGNVTVANAVNATTATRATNADNATNATYATTAGSATTAGHAISADSATTATSANTATYATTAGSATTADSATKAGHATTADSATNATYASSAGSATSAGTATKATRIMVSPADPYCSITITDGSGATDKIFTEGLCLVTYATDGITLSGVGYIGTNSGSLKTYFIGLGKVALLYSEGTDGAEVSLMDLTDSSPTISKNGTLTFIRIGEIAQG